MNIARKHFELYPPREFKFNSGEIPANPSFRTVTMESEKLKRFRNDYLVLLQFACDVLDKDAVNIFDIMNWYGRSNR